MLDQVLKEKNKTDTTLIPKQGKLLHESEAQSRKQSRRSAPTTWIIYGAEIYMELV